MICLVVFIVILPFDILFLIAFVAFVKSIFKPHKQDSTYHAQIPSEERKQTTDDSIEDSEADGLMLFDDPLFPEEFYEDEE